MKCSYCGGDHYNFDCPTEDTSEGNMKLTDIIDSMNKHLETNGDTDVLSFKIVDETGGHEWFMYSQTMVNPVTRTPKRMTPKEFMKYIGKEKVKTAQ
jgi:hypothetical protein